MKSYLCPHCNKVQTTIIEWETASVSSEHNLETKEVEQKDIIYGGDHDAFSCPECGVDLEDISVTDVFE